MILDYLFVASVFARIVSRRSWRHTSPAASISRTLNFMMFPFSAAREFSFRHYAVPFESQIEAFVDDNSTEIVRAAVLQVKKESVSKSAPRPVRDREIESKAAELGVRLDKFENRGLEEQAFDSVRSALDTNSRQGIGMVLDGVKNETFLVSGDPVFEKSALFADSFDQQGDTALSSKDLFASGANKTRSWQDMLRRRSLSMAEDFSSSTPFFIVRVNKSDLAGASSPPNGFDLFTDPSSYLPPVDRARMLSELAEGTTNIYDKFPLDIDALDSDKLQLGLLANDLFHSDPALHPDILRANRDLMMSDNFIYLMHVVNATNREPSQRAIMAKVAQAASEVLQELALAVKGQSIRHLQTIHDV